MRAATALLAVLDKDADGEKRLDGALLIAAFMFELSLIRSVFAKVEWDDDV